MSDCNVFVDSVTVTVNCCMFIFNLMTFNFICCIRITHVEGDGKVELAMSQASASDKVLHLSPSFIVCWRTVITSTFTSYLHQLIEYLVHGSETSKCLQEPLISLQKNR